MESHEKRANRRVEVTPLKSREGQLEILAYSTRSHGTALAIPVLLVDVSEGGLQRVMPIRQLHCVLHPRVEVLV
jgi:hypothetical protein